MNLSSLVRRQRDPHIRVFQRILQPASEGHRLLSHHLKTLRAEQLVECSQEGKNRRYRLAQDVKLDPSGRGLDLGCCRLELNEGIHA